ncbi:winged helix-turn-helix transcriptional regulator [Sphingomonas histidinilytica]|jgi:Lrp/AsnC family transcriptional regulator|uniref:Transcriptional regulator, AsnC family n=1 Tax=Rhizorhabdus histidinilytica TaxID=439228 RepID=A0A1T5GWC7_9SPHN|nr:Lrp/AsnC family transcriptional regulator [Rhizorhabdus histidinilytica]MBO9377008.1 winged helix-turn-helix transcriptional regulator [Rhizorhabdus histidinilytica]QEH80117.1 Lrp/AsnC family transcriptional regulator [Sphingomonas sp. C8-2]SKC12762.1 transcriptional regulator, AsnC family [Rhizorhabdus histidinilytica]
MPHREEISLDRFDRSILRELQRDATLSNAELARRVGLSATPCWNRVKRMQEAGVITGTVALVNREAIGLGVTVFVAIKTNHHASDWLSAFADHVRAIPEVAEFYRMSGETDYLLKVVAADIADYDRIYKMLIDGVTISDVSSSFAMEQIKYTTEVPV